MRIRSHPWAATALGPLEGWPEPLRAALRFGLASAFPSAVYWGADLLLLHNDAWLDAFGERHPEGLGQPARDVWGELWPVIGPQLTGVLASGRSASAVNQHLPLHRQGGLQDTYWTYSFSPLTDEDGTVRGVLAQGHETTGAVQAERIQRAEAERFRDMFQQAPSAIAVLRGPDHVFEVANAAYARLVGRRNLIGLPVLTALPEMVDQGFGRLLDDVYRTGEAFIGTGIPLLLQAEPGGPVDTMVLDFIYQPVLDAAGAVSGIFVEAIDVTEHTNAVATLRAAKSERDFIIALSARQRALTSPEAVMSLTAEWLGRRLDADRVHFCTLDTGCSLHFGAGWAEAPDAAQPPPVPAESIDQEVRQRFEAGMPVVGDPASAPSTLRLFGPAALAGVAVPRRLDGRWTGGLHVGQDAGRRWLPAEVALIEEVASLTWLTVERAEAVALLGARLAQQSAAYASAASSLVEETAGRLTAESQLRQLQKMEAVGQLAGGIAHDFNNMLAVVMGGLTLMQRRLARGDTDVTRYLDAALDGAQRAAALTQRLLAFSRQQTLAPEAVDANQLVGGMTELLTRTLGEHNRIESNLAPSLWTCRADPSQLENVVLNLAVNARDAMPAGGTLRIVTENLRLSVADARQHELAPGPYVCVTVSDTGAGMTPDVLARALEPFFTTKGVGKGTGLGLSQAFGFARQSGGHLAITSTPGQGTSVRVLLPRFEGASAAKTGRRRAAMRRGQAREVILVVEDEARVRTFAVEALRELGYSVVHAANGDEALAMLEAGQGVSLLFTDVVMPGMTGRQLADRATALRPGLKVLFTTGYARDAIGENGVLDPGTTLLAKPFGIEALAIAARNALDG